MDDFRVFISYAVADTPAVVPLMEVLREAGYDMVDATLFTGTPTRDQLYGMMLTCHAFVSLLAPASVESEICKRAYEAAVEAGLPVVALMPDDILTQDVGLLIQNAVVLPPDEVVLPESAPRPAPEPSPAPNNRPIININMPRWIYAVPGIALLLLAAFVLSQPRPEPVSVVTATPGTPESTIAPTITITPSPTITLTPTITPTPLPAGAVPFAGDAAGVLVAAPVEGMTDGLTAANVEFSRISQPVRSHDEARSLATAYNAAVMLWSAPEDDGLFVEFMPANPPDLDRIVPQYWHTFEASDAPYLLPFVEALNHLVKQDYAGALELLDEAVGFIPAENAADQHAEIVYFYRAVVHDWLEQYEAAIADANRVIELRPDLPEAYFNRGVANYQNAAFAEAIDDYTHVIELLPDDPIAYYYRGNVHLTTEKLDDALADYDRALAIRPDYVTALNNRGTVYGKQGNFDAALANYNLAIEINPNFASAYANRGLVYRNLADYDRAIADYDRAIQLDPNRPEAYYTRGTIYASLKQYDTALVNFNRAAILAPDDPKIYYMRGITRVFQQDGAGAEADFKQAISLQPTYADPYAALGALYQAQGQRDAAIGAYQQHIALAGDHPLAFAVSGLQQLQAAITPEGP